jgi:Fe2+ transport system protein FeoA
VLGIVNGEIVKVTDESVQKEIDINTVLGIVNGEIVKVTDESVQKETISQLTIPNTSVLISIS